MPESNSKACRRCGTTKPISAFAVNASKHDGLQTWCRQCKVEAQRENRRRPPKDPNAPPPPVPTHQTCSKCGGLKPLADFYKSSSGLHGREKRCKSCFANYSKQHYEERRKKRKFPISVETKHCPRCETTKAAVDFVPSSHRSDGLSRHCRVCDKEVRDEKGHYRKVKAERPEFVLERARQYRLKNLELMRARDRQYAKEARKRKPEVFREIGARKRAELIRAKPVWADIKAMRAIYRKAHALEKQDGIKRHVDHIIPLRSKLVCGLHVHQNLRIITQEENLRKTNKFEVQ